GITFLCRRPADAAAPGSPRVRGLPVTADRAHEEAEGGGERGQGRRDVPPQAGDGQEHGDDDQRPDDEPEAARDHRLMLATRSRCSCTLRYWTRPRPLMPVAMRDASTTLSGSAHPNACATVRARATTKHTPLQNRSVLFVRGGC